ncbi:MAG: Gmad2 immunoglobulin-like domain-containing protein [Bacillus sp. (in: Bacteria)]|nr:Gmad2 immunoglobulin-like domain-containing protein [Bacillus sp. (in: firmicutes)]
MKKIAYLLVVLTASVGLVACNDQEVKEVEKEKISVTEPKDGNKTNEEVVEKTNEQAENKSDPVKPDSTIPDETVYQNEVFKDVVVAKTENKISVTGKAQVFEGVFQYALYNGEDVLLANNYQTDGAPAGGEFEITFEKSLVTSNETKFELFVYSAKDGSKVNSLEIPIPNP